jgi:hypothetical protein
VPFLDSSAYNDVLRVQAMNANSLSTVLGCYEVMKEYGAAPDSDTFFILASACIRFREVCTIPLYRALACADA